MRTAHKRAMACLWRSALAGLLVASVSVPTTLPRIASAAPPSKIAAALINAAQKEFDAGNFERAGDLFHQIWRQDNSQVAALYNAARAYHLAGRADAAGELYR